MATGGRMSTTSRRVPQAAQTVTVFATGNGAHVQERFWAGMNRPGGAAKVVAVHEPELGGAAAGGQLHRATTTYDVKFIVNGGSKKGVALCYVLPLEALQPAQRRGCHTNAAVAKATPAKRTSHAKKKTSPTSITTWY